MIYHHGTFISDGRNYPFNEISVPIPGTNIFGVQIFCDTTPEYFMLDKAQYTFISVKHVSFAKIINQS